MKRRLLNFWSLIFKMSEKGDKYLAADYNVRWTRIATVRDNPWSRINRSVATHRQKTKDGPPAGSNLCYLDGHVEWISPTKMAYKDTDCIYPDPDVNPGDRGKYAHTEADRDYYW